MSVVASTQPDDLRLERSFQFPPNDFVSMIELEGLPPFHSAFTRSEA